jgi:hypothetical protein
MPNWAFDAATRAPADGYLGDPARHHAVVKKLIATRAELAALHSGD